MIRRAAGRMPADMQWMLLVCLGIALATLAVAMAVGRPVAGVAVGVGLVIGCANPLLVRQAIRLNHSFAQTTFIRLALMSASALAAGFLLGLDLAWLVLLGLAASQLALAGISAMELAKR